MSIRRFRNWCVAPLAVGLGSLWAAPTAMAWDVSSTHIALTEAALLDSGVHRVLMDESGLTRGIFSALRVDPARLEPAERRLLERAQLVVHADSGAAARGGPGSCPAGNAPIETKRYCVDGDMWELTVTGWLRLGVFAELTPSARAAHHFLDHSDPRARVWDDPNLRAGRLRRRQASHNGASFASRFTRLPSGADAESVWSWIDDADDPLAPARLLVHLEQSRTAETAAERDHHLALALVCTGALLHVVQDTAVPAHARGDALAFFSALSTARRDRGLPLAEFVRSAYGRRDLPRSATPRDGHLASTIGGHILADEAAAWRSPADIARTEFLSESRLPAARSLDVDSSAQTVAATLLETLDLSDEIRAGATLSPWPSDRGYVLDSTGGPLFAFVRVDQHFEFFLDDRVYRYQAQRLLPLAADVGRSLLDLLYPAWPSASPDDPSILSIPTDWTDVALHTLVEDEHGTRKSHGRVELTGGRHALPAAPQPAAGERVVFVVEATRPGGVLLISQHPAVPAKTEAAPVEAAPVDAAPVDAAPVDAPGGRIESDASPALPGGVAKPAPGGPSREAPAPPVSPPQSAAPAPGSSSTATTPPGGDPDATRPPETSGPDRSSQT